ncbi:MAG: sarcosine oxidase subunit alpha family protein [Hyphomicrobiaceae bacterium]
MSAPFRLSKGGLIDRNRTIKFSFDGKSYEGYPGDTLASALIANGVHMVARGFKYHRPRGIVGAGSDDPAALVQIGRDGISTDPNTRVTEAEIFDGLVARPQNVWPSLNFDVGALNDLFWKWLSAGFYYKTFMGFPGWMFYEKHIRNAAGLGVAPAGADPEHYQSFNRHVDVLVAGGGAAGLMAALGAARSGARVILCEETAHLGGSLLALDPMTNRIGGLSPQAWVKSMADELAKHPEVTVLTRTVAFGYYADNFVGLHQSCQDHLTPQLRKQGKPRQQVWRVRAAEVVLATGAAERPLVFHGNDRPGIMLAGAVSTYIHRYAALPGKRPIVFTNNASAWTTAFDLARAGAQVQAIVDTRAEVESQSIAEAKALGIPVYTHSGIVATRGRKRVNLAVIRSLDGQGGVTGPETTLTTDLVAVSGGWSANAALFSHSRGKLAWDPGLQAFRPAVSWQRERSAGGANGKTSFADTFAEGARAGADAATKAGFTAEPPETPKLELERNIHYRVDTLVEVPSGLDKSKTRAFIDLQNDVQAKDVKQAVKEGYRSIEHVKRFTTTGMGSDQGKLVNVNAFGIIAKALGQTIPETGITTYRQPFKPVTFGALAGQHAGPLYAPRRTTPMHDWHVDRGAIFEPVGDWLRAQTYPKAGETFQQAVQRETKAARTGVGILDASTLGKIEIKGKDAREFLNRVYTNAWKKLGIGRCRYGLMLREDGMVFDDGVTACLADDHFHMTTTTGGAARVLGWLEEYLQTEWTDLDVYMNTVTEQWAVASICGPGCEKIIAKLCPTLDASEAALPFMAFKESEIDGLPVRVFRISFTGEHSYEINIGASYGLWLWEKIFEVAKSLGIEVTPYGTEAMHVLRAEKGFIIVGQDTDGTVTPVDLRMDGLVKKDADFIGKRSLTRSDTARTNRKQLVGLLTEDPGVVLMEGAHVIATSTEPAPPVPMLGYVTSSYMSPNLGRSIALALVQSGGKRMGETLYVSRRNGTPIPVKVTEIDFLKAQGGRS